MNGINSSSNLSLLDLIKLNTSSFKRYSTICLLLLVPNIDLISPNNSFIVSFDSAPFGLCDEFKDSVIFNEFTYFHHSSTLKYFVKAVNPSVYVIRYGKPRFPDPIYNSDLTIS